MKGYLFFFIFYSALLITSATAKDFFDKSYLGEKRLDSYAERYAPLIFQDIYRGHLNFSDDLFFQNFFSGLIFEEGPELNFFINSELYSAQSCSNEQLGSHFEDIRYSYRLITFSYLLEGQWHLSELAKHLGTKSCDFDLVKFTKSCNPQSTDMKKFISRLEQFNPKYQDKFSRSLTQASWWKEYMGKKYSHYSQYKMNSLCGNNCVQSEMPKYLSTMCNQHLEAMTKICSETDEVWGLSQHLEAYYLLSTSNITALYNKRGEANGCLRRFSEIMANKEPRYVILKGLFPPIYDYLKRTHKERFLQGRVFFYGAAKEYEQKGLADIWVKDQTLVVEKATELSSDTAQVVVKKIETKKEVAKVEPAKVEQVPVKVFKPEMPVHPQSAFLQAAQERRKQNLDRLAVDMLKLKYDYVFTLAMTNSLSERLKNFMTQDALKEMANFDKLGSKSGPVPLMFLKFMIDYQEHQGLWNLISVLGTRFYVSNEIDAHYKPSPEQIELVNDASTNRNWQIYIIKP